MIEQVAQLSPKHKSQLLWPMQCFLKTHCTDLETKQNALCRALEQVKQVGEVSRM